MTIKHLLRDIGAISVCSNNLPSLSAMRATIMEGAPSGLVDNGLAVSEVPAAPATMRSAWSIRNFAGRCFWMACKHAEEATFSLFLKPRALPTSATLAEKQASPLAWLTIPKWTKEGALMSRVPNGRGG